MATHPLQAQLKNLPEQGEWTYEAWRLLPEDGFRYEVIDGELFMSPPPSIGHQNSVTLLASRMRNFADTNDLGLVLTSPVGVRLPGQEVPLQPDIVFVRRENSEIVAEEYIEGTPDLVVEVLSPSNWIYDRGKKQETYRRAGVREYWIVDYRTKKVEVLVLEGADYVLRRQYTEGETAVSEALENFTVAVADVFAR